ncbi:type II secretion system major pseudopilin GspG [Sphingomonas sp. SUN039]|uniref:type II secretion system major pseudopilin GspG n=1 Tax=Sphingomonas sp. SUN039 TaxID=2937787 RepID=UPI0021649774|nr:type II secretion system major pseudopilin GspG [Sphingomonas sp. SUN039]UVO53918.1 type II secretion system major pseudopilin GspG [Sphingomonas sp. SUN039]
MKKSLPARATSEEGFTLVELMVVIVIIGLLATLVALTVLPQLGKANDQKAKADIATLDQALELYRLNNLTYPATAEGLGALKAPPPSLSDPSRYQAGGYIKKLPKDPWGRDYKYENPGKHGPYDIYTLGADGAEGGTGENADIGNWQ